jgi:hypothetical protein
MRSRNRICDQKGLQLIAATQDRIGDHEIANVTLPRGGVSLLQPVRSTACLRQPHNTQAGRTANAPGQPAMKQIVVNQPPVRRGDRCGQEIINPKMRDNSFEASYGGMLRHKHAELNTRRPRRHTTGGDSLLPLVSHDSAAAYPITRNIVCRDCKINASILR